MSNGEEGREVTERGYIPGHVSQGGEKVGEQRGSICRLHSCLSLHKLQC